MILAFVDENEKFESPFVPFMFDSLKKEELRIFWWKPSLTFTITGKFCRTTDKIFLPVLQNRSIFFVRQRSHASKCSCASAGRLLKEYVVNSYNGSAPPYTAHRESIT